MGWGLPVVSPPLGLAQRQLRNVVWAEADPQLPHTHRTVPSHSVRLGFFKLITNGAHTRSGGAGYRTHASRRLWTRSPRVAVYGERG